MRCIYRQAGKQTWERDVSGCSRVGRADGHVGHADGKGTFRVGRADGRVGRADGKGAFRCAPEWVGRMGAWAGRMGKGRFGWVGRMGAWAGRMGKGRFQPSPGGSGGWARGPGGWERGVFRCGQVPGGWARGPGGWERCRMIVFTATNLHLLLIFIQVKLVCIFKTNTCRMQYALSELTSAWLWVSKSCALRWDSNSTACNRLSWFLPHHPDDWLASYASL